MSTASPPPPVRVVLADMSRLTRELICRILDEEPGVQVVSEVSDAEFPLRQLIEDADAEVVIVGADALGLLAECREFLEEHAPLRVLAVSADGRDAHLYGVRPYEMVVEDFSTGFVLEVAGAGKS